MVRVAFAQGQVGAGTATVSFSINPTGSNLTAFIFVSNENGSNESSVTIAGNNATLVDKQTPVSMWYRTGILAGSQTVSVTRGSTSGSLYAWCAIYDDTRQTGIPDASTKGTATSVTSRTGTLTTIANNCRAVMIARADNAGMAPSTNCTEISTPISGYDAWAIFENSTGAITPAGSYSMTYTGNNGGFDYVMASFAPFVADTFLPQAVFFE